MLEHNLIVASTVGEETGGLGADAFREWLGKKGIVIDELVVSEPTQCIPIYGCVSRPFFSPGVRGYMPGCLFRCLFCSCLLLVVVCVTSGHILPVTDCSCRHKGTSRIQVDLEGLAAHSSLPHLGRNAIVAVAELILAVNKVPPIFHSS